LIAVKYAIILAFSKKFLTREMLELKIARHLVVDNLMNAINVLIYLNIMDTQ